MYLATQSQMTDDMCASVTQHVKLPILTILSGIDTGRVLHRADFTLSRPMPSPAPLRLVASRAEKAALPVPLAATRPVPPEIATADKALAWAAGASLIAHAAMILWMALNGVFGEERAAGAAEDLVLIE